MAKWFFAAAFFCCATACGNDEPEPFVVLFAVDGASPEMVSELRALGKLPNLDRLIREGAYGPMESLAARRVLQDRPRRGYWSPIVWASMATGQVPEKHGIVDFLLPRAGTSFAWIGTEDGPPEASLRLQELSGAPPHELRLRLRSYPPNGEQDVVLALNGSPVGTVRVTEDWGDFALPLSTDSLRAAENRLHFTFERQSRPSDHGPSRDDRTLAGALARVEVVEAGGATVASFDPIYDRFSLGRGFHKPEAKVVEAQSVHFRRRPFWSLLGEKGHPVGIVGFWSTWPAYEVNGFLVSSRMGVRGERQGTETKLTWPPELVHEVAPLAPNESELDSILRTFYPSSCRPLEKKKLEGFEKIVWQDAFYHRMALELLPTLDRGFFTVYYESVDGAGHHFLPLRQGGTPTPGCPESVRDVVDKTYNQIDTWIGELLETLPEHAIVLVASDHGMAGGVETGFHAPFGVLLASGPGIRKGASTRGTTVLDVAPTILHLFGEAIPYDIDGKVVVQAFDAEWLAAHPPSYVETETSITLGAAPDASISDEHLERLRSLGYVK